MAVTGLDRGIPLSDILSALWTEPAYSPHLFSNLDDIYVERTAVYHARPEQFVDDRVLKSHESPNALYCVLRSYHHPTFH